MACDFHAAMILSRYRAWSSLTVMQENGILPTSWEDQVDA